VLVASSPAERPVRSAGRIIHLLTIAEMNSSVMPQATPSAPRDLTYRTIAVDGVNIFYREAGPADGPVVLLLHGWPSSSHMFRDLIPKLADRFHLIAPDYPGFGYSDAPSTSDFTYTFDNLAALVEKFVAALGITKLSLYVQDYGGPIGFRLASKNPELIRGLVVQNAIAHTDGISENLAPLARYWEDQGAENETAVRGFLTFDTTKFQYTHGAAHPERISPDAYTLDQARLDRLGNDAIQLALFLDYRSNPPQFPIWQKYLRTHRPPMLVVWGKNDPFFTPAGAQAIARDNPNATVMLVDGGHFALEEYSTEIAAEMRALADRVAAGTYQA
jgi:pimeloyl-ACP methyl ester carboxylesterase